MYISSRLTMFKFKFASWLLGKDHTIIKTPNGNIIRTQKELIDDIMDNFNFKKVQSVMKFLNWKWVTAEEGVPTVMEIRREAKKLLLEVCQTCIKLENISPDTQVCVGTGGLLARAFKSECGKFITNLELQFILAGWDSEAENE